MCRRRLSDDEKRPYHLRQVPIVGGGGRAHRAVGDRADSRGSHAPRRLRCGQGSGTSGLCSRRSQPGESQWNLCASRRFNPCRTVAQRQFFEGVAETGWRLSLFFEANVGQTDPRVRYFARAGGYVLFLTPDKAVFALNRPRPHQPGADRDMDVPRVVQFSFDRVSRDASLHASDETAGKVII